MRNSCSTHEGSQDIRKLIENLTSGYHFQDINNKFQDISSHSSHRSCANSLSKSICLFLLFEHYVFLVNRSSSDIQVVQETAAPLPRCGSNQNKNIYNFLNRKRKLLLCNA
jgi:hypothetical protein